MVPCQTPSPGVHDGESRAGSAHHRRQHEQRVPEPGRRATVVARIVGVHEAIAAGLDLGIDAAGRLDLERPGSRTAHDRFESTTATHADDELRRVHAAGKFDQRGGDLLCDDLVKAAAKSFDEFALVLQRCRVAFGEPVRTRDVHGEQLAAAGSSCSDCTCEPAITGPKM